MQILQQLLYNYLFFAFVISVHELNIDCIYKYNNYLIIIHDCLAHKQHNVIGTLI